MPQQEIVEHNLRWIHLSQPTAADIASIKDLHPFHETVVEYLRAETLHPMLEEFGEYLYFILHVPLIYRSNRANASVEIDFLLTKNLLVTVTYHRCPPLEQLFKQYTADAQQRARHMRNNSGFLVYGILDHLLRALITDHDYIDEAITKLERRIFDHPDDRLVADTANVRRDVLDLRRVFTMQSTVLTLLPAAMRRLLGTSTLPRFTNLVVTHDRIAQLITNHKDTVDALHDTHQALVASRTSQIVRLLTIFSATLLPLSLVASIWGMNHAAMPLRDGRYDFWLVVGLMVVLATGLLVAFRKVRWL